MNARPIFAVRACACVVVVLGATAASCSSAAPRFSVPAVQHAQAVAGQVQGPGMQKDVGDLVGARLHEVPEVSKYYLQTLHTHINSGEFAANGFAAAGLTPVREKTSDGGLELTNVYADVRGTAKPDEIVIVSAHHDAWFQSGADDDGTGIAVLIQAARILKASPAKRTIRIIAFDREEEGLIGSVRYQAAHANDHVRIVLNMDCVGFASHAKGSQSAPPGLGLRDTGDFLAVIANSPASEDVSRIVQLAPLLPAPVDVVALIAPDDSYYPAEGQFLRSDHTPFWRTGVPAFFITDTADFRNKHYHTEGDQPETLDYDFLNRVGQLVVGAAAAFADAD